MKKGILAVITGNGKGKTTSALGQALRAAGHGMKICFIQFIKGSWKYGELEAVKRLDDCIDFHVMGKGFTWKSEDIEKDRSAARGAWEKAQQAIFSGAYQMVILDEFTYLLHYNMLEKKSALEVLSNKPADLHIIITGRYAPDALTQMADLVTEMTEVKHHFKAGVNAQKGIEF